jgi:hypothetical protein
LANRVAVNPIMWVIGLTSESGGYLAPARSAAKRPCAGCPQQKRVLHRWRLEGACQQKDSVQRSAAPCAHNQPHSLRSHGVRVRPPRSCLTQLARLYLAAGRQSARSAVWQGLSVRRGDDQPSCPQRQPSHPRGHFPTDQDALKCLTSDRVDQSQASLAGSPAWGQRSPFCGQPVSV